MHKIAPIALLAAILLIGGCATKEPKPVAEIDVFGIKPGEKEDLKTLNGITAEREPCINGYEYVYEPIALRIGYRPDGTIRAITTRNGANKLFGVKIGDARPDAEADLLSRGFTRTKAPDTYANPPLRLTLLVGHDQKVFGMRLELME